MKSLAHLRARLDELLAKQADTDAPPEVVIMLPANGREPDGDTRPYPHVNRLWEGGGCRLPG